MSQAHSLQDPMPALLGELAHLNVLDQDAIFQGLLPAQARALRHRLADYPSRGEAGFSAQVDALLAVQPREALAPSSDFVALSRLDLSALPVGMVATLLLNSRPEERERLLRGEPAQRQRNVQDLLGLVGEGELSQASASLRTLLMDGQHDRVAVAQLSGFQTGSPWPAQAQSVMERIFHRIRSWLVK